MRTKMEGLSREDKAEAEPQKAKRTAPGIRCWSPTQLLIERLLA